MTFRKNHVFLLLLVGVAGIGFAPVLAKLAVDLDGGSGADILSPVSVAFWRMVLAIPFFLTLNYWPRRSSAEGAAALTVPLHRSSRRFSPLLLLPGFIFAIDLSLWHWSFEFTSVANSTLEANLSVIIVSLAGWIFFKEKFRYFFPLGVLLALIGIGRLVGAGFNAGGQTWIGDLLGIATAFAYGSYQLSIKYLSRRFKVSTLLLWSSAVSSAVLLAIAMVTPGRILPQTAAAWHAIIGLTICSQMIGQALIAYAISRLSLSLTGVTLILQPVLAAVWGWMILGQELTLLQTIDCLIVVVGIGLAKLGSIPTAADSDKPASI